MELDINRMAELVGIAESKSISEIGGFIKRLETAERIFVQNQIALKDRYLDRLPEIFRLKGIIMPTRLSLQQASSESTAAYKSKVISGYLKENNVRRYIDITGGFGVDFTVIALSLLEKELIDEAIYIEQDTYLYNIYKHNLGIISSGYPSLKKVKTINDSSEVFLRDIDFGKSFVYADPARRDKSGMKVFLLEDCSPDLAMISNKYDPIHFMYKLSPILDLDYIGKKVKRAGSIHCVEHEGELKEILAVSTLKKKPFYIIKISDGGIAKELAFERSSERCVEFLNRDIQSGDTILIPSPAASKSSLLDTTDEYRLKKISKNTNIYFIQNSLDDYRILGRLFKVIEIFKYKSDKRISGGYNIIAKNFTDKPSQISKKMRIKEGGEKYLIAFRNRKVEHRIAVCEIL